MNRAMPKTGIIKRVGEKTSNMKSFIIIALSCLTWTKNFSQQLSDSLIQEFLNSQDFYDYVHLTQLQLAGTINYEKCSVSFIENDTSMASITIVYFNNGELSYTIEAHRKLNGNILLPRGAKYFMLLRDFHNYNASTGNGSITLYDLNYEEHPYLQANLENGSITETTFTPLPESILSHYESISSWNLDYIQSLSEEERVAKRVCDLNGNGNITFSECYTCFNRACAADPNCNTHCYLFGDVVGWVTIPGYPMCQTSIALSCIWIAIRY
jgi:hypothetical protein